MSASIEKRVIKKYPNRRLYDTNESKYITLEDVKKLVVSGEQFCVVDKKSGDDITRSILLQIIIEQEDAGEPLFSTDALQQLIGFYSGGTARKAASTFLEQSVAMMTEQQEFIKKQFSSAVQGNPITAMSEMTQRNLDLWRRMQSDFFQTARPTTAAETETTPSDPKEDA